MAARYFFGDDEVVGDVRNTIQNLTIDQFHGIFHGGMLQLPENAMRHLLARDGPKEVEVFMGLTEKETINVYFWRGGLVEKQSPDAFRQEESIGFCSLLSAHASMVLRLIHVLDPPPHPPPPHPSTHPPKRAAKRFSQPPSRLRTRF